MSHGVNSFSELHEEKQKHKKSLKHKQSRKTQKISGTQEIPKNTAKCSPIVFFKILLFSGGVGSQGILRKPGFHFYLEDFFRVDTWAITYNI